MCTDPMHSLHKAFKDHTWTWIVNMVTPAEIDQQFQCLPRTTGYRCFDGGISKISQWSIKDARNIERYALAVAAGNLDKAAVSALRAELDFIYTAEWEQISELDLAHLEEYNQEFHDNKHIFIDPRIGGRRGKHGVMTHFNIPKLHARHHIPDNIRDCGASRNFSAQITERYHIDIVKDAYAATNRRDVTEQMVRWLNRQERILQFDSYLHWELSQNNLLPQSSFATQSDSENEEELISPVPQRGNRTAGKDGTSPHQLTKQPSLRRMSIAEISATFQIPELYMTLCKYVGVTNLPTKWQEIDVWYKTRVRLPELSGDERKLRETILARPGTGHALADKLPRFHTVFVDRDPSSNTIQDGLEGGLFSKPVVRV
jgi:hypothetical protein